MLTNLGKGMNRGGTKIVTREPYLKGLKMNFEPEKSKIISPMTVILILSIVGIFVTGIGAETMSYTNGTHGVGILVIGILSLILCIVSAIYQNSTKY